jgi:hypothetical protein
LASPEIGEKLKSIAGLIVSVFATKYLDSLIANSAVILATPTAERPDPGDSSSRGDRDSELRSSPPVGNTFHVLLRFYSGRYLPF